MDSTTNNATDVDRWVSKMRQDMRLRRESLIAVTCDSEDALEASLQRLAAAAGADGAASTVLRRRGGGGADVLVRRQHDAAVELRVAVIGNVDAGKSTLISVLTSSSLDDGRGAARRKVFRHAHESETGRTSSISQQSICFSSAGRILNNENTHRGVACEQMVHSASKVLTLVDLAGHESYLRTTCYGCTAHFPDFAMVVVGANAGLIGMSREHVGIALALKVPAFFVVSKIDFSPEEKTKATVADLVAVLKRPGVRKRPFIVRTDADVFSAAYNMASDTIAPIFLVSCVDGRGLDRLRLYLNLLPQRTDWGLRETEPAEFHIDDVFSVSGVGTVVAGTLKSGTITDASRLLLGPDPGDGQFKAAVVRSIHFKSAPASRVVAGQAAALALKKVKRGAVRKGMVLVAPSMAPQATWTFDAEVSVLTHSSTIVPRYQAVIHVGVVRQTAVIVSLSCDGGVLRSGGHAVVTFRFLLRPEYIVSGARFIFREVRRLVDASKVAPATDVAYAQGRTKGVGVVLPPGTLKA